MFMLGTDIDHELRLELLTPHHAGSLSTLIEKSRVSLREWLPWVDSSRSIKDSLNYIHFELDKLSKNRGFQMGIWFRGQLAGVIGFHEVDWTNRKVSLGYWLGDGYRGKGLMRRSCRKLVDFAFTVWDLQRVEILCAVGNTKSQAIPKSIGFTQEGVKRHCEWLNDHFVDHIVFSLLKTEWLVQNSKNASKSE